MSLLIDSLMDNKEGYKGKWVVSKPLLNSNIISRILDAYEVLVGHSIAVHFYKKNGSKELKDVR